MPKSTVATQICVVAVSWTAIASAFAADWKPQTAPIMTRWAAEVRPENVHAEYPRPQMVREQWVNLNGLWDYAIRPRSEISPQTYDGQILVPFPVESALSGVMQRVPDNARLWYRRKFDIPKMDNDGRLWLHFGAVDWQATIWVNGKQVGEHQGGYDPFTIDITDALITYQATDVVDPAGGQELIVSVSDPTDGSFQPRGKQVRNPHGIWYTPTTGIWQTVWLEPVSSSSLQQLHITPILDREAVRIEGDWKLAVGKGKVRIEVLDGETVVATASHPMSGLQADIELKTDVTLPLKEAKLWTPDSPHLYDVKVTLDWNDTTAVDVVRGYFGMRKISLGKDEQGVNRLLLNDKPLFQYGPLDQGFWPDGLYTAPNDEALRYDIEMTKKLGFNMIRKHVKVEPDRWYYWCDKLGMLVWQDMPSGDKHAEWDPFGRHNNTEATRSPESSENYDREWKAIIDGLRNHPCIVMWVPFNEGWGQANTVAVTKWTKEYDPTRLVNCASGGNDFPVGDVIDVHRYPGPFAPKPTAERAAVLGEFGGLGLPLEGHTWQGKDNWGYRSFTKNEDLQPAYVGLLSALRPMIAQGVSAAVYTQTTDVEIEVNGLMTYDRAILKMDAEVVANAARKLHLPPPKITTLVPTSEETARTWQFTTEKPADGWEQPVFDASSWKSGPGGFGEPSTPGSVVKTNWKTGDIWLRRDFEIEQFSAIHELALRIHHDEDADVFLNGELIAKVTGFTTQYIDVPLDQAAAELLKGGKNTLAVHCHQTGGGQYIDVGLVDVEEVAK